MAETAENGLPRWDLSDLYSGIDDPAIGRDLRNLLFEARNFERNYRGKIAAMSATPESALAMLHMLREYEFILRELTKLGSFAMLAHSADSENSANGALLQKIQTRSTDIGNLTLFAAIELTQLDDASSRWLVNDAVLHGYRHFLKTVFDSKPHRITEAEEKIVNDKALTGCAAFVRLFDEEMSAKEYGLPADLASGTPARAASKEELLSMLYSNDRAIRKTAAESFSRGLEEDLRRHVFILNTLALDKAQDDKLFRFHSPEASRHFGNEVEQRTVDAMISAVSANYGIVQDFYRFKKGVLGLPELYDYDRYASVSQSEKSFSFGEAKDIILRAFVKFSPAYRLAAERFFAGNWIDAAPRRGKRGGAFCAAVTPDLHPYVLVNYNGHVDEVLTLAHELGHGVHDILGLAQTIVNFDCPLVMAETASTFAEMLVFDELKNVLGSKEEKFALYMNKIEGIFATVFRQTAMHKFEQDFHGAVLDRGELTSDEINQIWRGRQSEMFGDSVILTMDYDKWWIHIPHFRHTPFYVYSYVFGELLTLSLYAQYKRSGAEFVRRYLNMLSLRGSQSPAELVEPLGIDLNNPDFWLGGLGIIMELVEETKRLYR